MTSTSLPNLAPLAALLVLIEISVGTSVLSHAFDLAGRIGRGFVGTTALICAAISGVALIIAANLPAPGSIIAGLRSYDYASIAHWLVAFTIALVVDALFSGVGTDIARKVVDAATSLIGVVLLLKTALLLSPSLGGTGTALVALGSATLLCGAAWAGMLLGHWYLINPNLSFKPLRQAVGLVFIAVIVEVIAVVYSLLAANPTSRAAVISGDDAVFFWLLVVASGIVFTTAVNGLTYYFARIRSNQPATAMLYVLIITVLMGVIPATLVYLQTSVAV